MKLRRKIISYLLLFLLAAAGLTGWLQVTLDIHRFVLHKWLAYATLIVAAVHAAPAILNRIKPRKKSPRADRLKK